MNKWAKVNGEVRKGKNGFWIVEIMIYIGDRKRQVLEYARTKKELMTKVNNPEWLQAYAEKHFIDEHGHLQYVAV